jgi:hypothetical protein
MFVCRKIEILKKIRLDVKKWGIDVEKLKRENEREERQHLRQSEKKEKKEKRTTNA